MLVLDRHDNARQIRHRFPYWPAQFFEQPARPQCARYIIEDLGLLACCGFSGFSGLPPATRRDLSVTQICQDKSGAVTATNPLNPLNPH